MILPLNFSRFQWQKKLHKNNSGQLIPVRNCLFKPKNNYLGNGCGLNSSLGGRFGSFSFSSVWGWGKGGGVQADGRGVGFYWKLEGGGGIRGRGGGGAQALGACWGWG